MSYLFRVVKNIGVKLLVHSNNYIEVNNLK